MIILFTPLVAATFITMNTLPILRSEDSYEPRSLIQSTYQYQNTLQSSVTADFMWTTKKPTLNLDNFGQIKEVDCSNDLIVVTFTTAQCAINAFKAWSNISDLAVMLGHEHKCKGIENVSTLSVERILEPKSNILIIDTFALVYEDLMDGYVLDISKSESKNIPVLTQSISHAQKNITEVVAGTSTNKSLSKRGLLNRTSTFHMDINYDRETKKVKRPLLKIPDSLILGKDGGIYTGISCRGCYLHGEATVSIHIETRKMIVTNYKVSVDGEIKANMDVTFKFGGIGIKLMKHFKLGGISLTPFTIPGLFTFGPKIGLEAVFDLVMFDMVEMNFGFDYTSKFHFTAESDSLFKKPTTTHIGKPVTNTHPFRSSNFAMLAIGSHLVPSIQLGLSMLGKDMLVLRFEIDNSIMARVSASTAQNCPTSSYNIALVQNHVAIVAAIIPKGPIFAMIVGAMPEYSVACAFCNKCLSK